MVDFPFQSLSTRLLKGGVAPKHVTRTIAELRDHFDDLKRESLERGLNSSEAEQDAITRLGSEDTIAADILAKPELKSWAARWPWAVYGLGPVLVFVLLAATAVLMFGSVMVIGKEITGARYIPPVWFQNTVDGAFLIAVYVCPILVAGWVSWQMALRKSDTLWPVIGLLVLCVVSAASDLSMTWPATPDGPGTLQFGFAYAPPFPDQAETVVRAVINITFVVALLRYFRQRQAPN